MIRLLIYPWRVPRSSWMPPASRHSRRPYPGLDVSTMIAVIGPAGVPRPLVDEMAADIRAVVASAEFAEKTEHLGLKLVQITPKELDG
jgi:tripartite-type tricarboxylate transporter receptor subunit TctC